MGSRFRGDSLGGMTPQSSIALCSNLIDFFFTVFTLLYFYLDQ